ncbi:MAG: phosphoglycerate dehydrogenase [Rhodospirillaceae bacterium]|nr:phosphoglycerate dehydrogenase [Rhodospirillaceae bacterium]
MTTPINLLLYGRMTTPWIEWMTDQLGAGFHISHWSEDDTPEALGELAPKADIIVGGRFSADTFPAVPNLKVWHIPFTGFDWLRPAALPAGCTVCNTFEHEIAIAEYIMAAMLEVEMGLGAVSARFKSHGWENRSPGTGEDRGELFGKTLGIVGYGHIGREAAKRAGAFGMQVLAASRRAPAPDVPQPDTFSTMDGLDAMLGESDYVLVTLPLSGETRGLFDAGRLAAMKPDGVLINVGRGKVIDEAALFAALRDNRIGGAVIDVWYQYATQDDPDPTPSKFPFEELDNVIMTPHMSALTHPMRTRRWQFVADNLKRFAAGEAVENVCLVV